ncbi:MAG: D-alanyl-D-alanine carboxypeptidase family protein [Micavibrio aeruginosavorus]|uniref:D-alanyl-D-alanine carboxypeptidase family protein n=1 Tax=Micavibrio aeruginosavorus TaxID=349221 RepID=A0A7T5UHE8_9BACT|nr:MAG: D-alanyl-D-alanine carboxypeptidase family protein [Micavibrio aeruginosavorus]
MSQTSALRVELIDFDSVKLVEGRYPLEIVEIRESDGFFLNRQFTSDFRIRKTIYEMMQAAQKKLPDNYYFMVYEAYRPLARQIALWNMATDYINKEYPDATPQQKRDMAETFVADPYNGIGSGHQACCAIDISLCDKSGKEYDMGTACQEISPLSNTYAEGLGSEAIKNRKILIEALEGEGFINYSSEWWHFSYGDHQWAYLKGVGEAFFGPIDI